MRPLCHVKVMPSQNVRSAVAKSETKRLTSAANQEFTPFHHAHRFLSRVRYWTASERCLGARSAIVRATLRMRTTRRSEFWANLVGKRFEADETVAHEGMRPSWRWVLSAYRLRWVVGATFGKLAVTTGGAGRARTATCGDQNRRRVGPSEACFRLADNTFA